MLRGMYQVRKSRTEAGMTGRRGPLLYTLYGTTNTHLCRLTKRAKYLPVLPNIYQHTPFFVAL